MSQIQTVFKLNYGKYFDQPPAPRMNTPSAADNDNIVNFSRQIRSNNPTTTSKVPVAIDTNGEEQHEEEKIMKNLAKKNNQTNDFESAEQVGMNEDTVASNMPITNMIPDETAGAGLDPKEVVDNLKAVAENSEAQGVSPCSQGAGNGGALAFNSSELARLGRGDNLSGAGPITAAAVSSLIAAAPQIIKAIGDVRKSNNEKAAGKIGRYTKKCVGGAYDQYKLKELSPEKLNELESLMKQVRSQKRYLSGDGMIGSGKFGTFMSNTWEKLKSIYNSEQFAPIKNALLNAASNTAQKYIDKAATNLSNRTQNEDLKNVISTTKDVASNLKNNLVDTLATSGATARNPTRNSGSGLTDAAGSLFGGSSSMNRASLGGSLSVNNHNEINEEADDYDLMSAGIKLYDDTEVENPVETTPNVKTTNKRLYHGSRFSVSATRCGRLNRCETKRLAL